MRNIWYRTRENLLSDPYGLSFTLFVLAVGSGVLGARLMLIILPSYSSAAAAAMTEPITTKFLPAYLSLHFAKSEARQKILKQPILFGAWGGLSFGLAERIMYFLDGAALDPLWTVSIGLHGVFGILVAGILYWRGVEPWSKSDIGIILLGISTAAIIHYVWNIIIV